VIPLRLVPSPEIDSDVPIERLIENYAELSARIEDDDGDAA